VCVRNLHQTLCAWVLDKISNSLLQKFSFACVHQDVTRNVERLDHLDDPKERKIYEAEVKKARVIMAANFTLVPNWSYCQITYQLCWVDLHAWMYFTARSMLWYFAKGALCVNQRLSSKLVLQRPWLKHTHFSSHLLCMHRCTLYPRKWLMTGVPLRRRKENKRMPLCSVREMSLFSNVSCPKASKPQLAILPI